MSMAAALQNDTIWLESANYHVLPLNEKLSWLVQELRNELRAGIPAYPDNSRQGFYDVELKNGWAYIHVHDAAQTVYLVAFSRN
jgi:hypothetical protein